MLPASVQAYRWSNEKEDGRPEKAAFARHAMPTHEDLVWWVENQVVYENTPGFPHSVHRFLIAYSRGGTGLPMVRTMVYHIAPHQPEGWVVTNNVTAWPGDKGQ